MFQTLALLSGLRIARSHGAMNKPCSWYDPDCKFGMGHWRDAGDHGYKGVDFFSNSSVIPGERTIPDEMLTFAKDPNVPKNHPWFAPGSAPVMSPCGISGGNPGGCPLGDPNRHDCPGGGYAHGTDARMLPGNTQPTVWRAGSSVEVAWAIGANHGGGYNYRLCKKSSEPWHNASARNMDVTEECFQASPLKFDGDAQWIQFGGDEQNRTIITAMRTTSGTTPSDSQWTRNPIPACADPSGGADGKCPDTQFPPPAPGIYGYYGYGVMGPAFRDSDRLHDMSIVDKVQLPLDLVSGDYVLSMRWDCEQNPQIWNTCADITIEGGLLV
jgi:hypothetical protein